MTSNALTETNLLQYLTLSEFDREGIRHFFTTKKTPVELPISRGFAREEENERDKNVPPIVNIYEDRRGFLTPSKGYSDNLILVNQVHGDDVLVIDKPVDDVKRLKDSAASKQCDAIITNQKNVGIGVVSADCLPALLYDPVHSVIAAVHAGWRGTLKGILSKVVRQMVELFDCRPEDIIAGIGPVIGPCCYEVSDIVAKPLKELNPVWGLFLEPKENGKSILDLTALNSFQIEEAGVIRKNIFNLGLCTSCNKDLFPSYRRDGIGTGRIISGIEMKSEQ